MFLFPKGSFSDGSVIKKSIEKDTASTSSTSKVENETLIEQFDSIKVETTFVQDISVFPKDLSLNSPIQGINYLTPIPEKSDPDVIQPDPKPNFRARYLGFSKPNPNFSLRTFSTRSGLPILKKNLKKLKECQQRYFKKMEIPNSTDIIKLSFLMKI